MSGMTGMADALRQWAGAILERFDDHLADGPGPQLDGQTEIYDHLKDTP